MKTFIKFFACGIFFFSLSSAYSQQGSFSTKIISFPDTSCLKCQSTFSVSVKNLDASNYSGYVNVSVSADTVAFSVASVCSTPTVTITALDSVQITCSIVFDSTYFYAGSNIIVVWSSGNARMPADSARHNVYLNSAGVGIHEPTNAFSFSLHPSLTSSYVQIELSKQEITLEKIRILDVFGREISSVAVSKREKKNRVDVSNLRNGIYFLEVSAGNLRSTRKFIKVD